MDITHDPEIQARQEIEQAELKLHRLYETLDRAPADEKAVVESQIEETKLTLERLKTKLHH